MTASHPAPTSESGSKFRTPVQKAALAVGVVFLGSRRARALFRASPRTMTNSPSPAITPMPHFSESSTCRYCTTSCTWHSVFAGIALARTFNSARSYLIGGGVVYLVLFIYGLVVDHDSSANFVPVNDADNWLHLGLAVAMIALGAALGRTRDDTGQPVGTGSRTQGSTPHRPAL